MKLLKIIANNNKYMSILIYKYNVLVNGKHVKTNILGYKAAKAYAKKCTGDLFGKNRVEILCLETGEIIEIQ